MSVAPFLVASVLRLVIATRRVRKLCPTCRQSYVPPSEQLQELKKQAGDFANQQTNANNSFPSSNTHHAAEIHLKKVIPAPSAEELAQQSILERIASDPNIIYRGITPPKVELAEANTSDPNPPPQVSSPQNSGFFRAVGCSKCNGTGYIGQLHLAEVLLVNEAVSTSIAQAQSEEQIRSLALQSGLIPLARDGLNKAGRGLTTISEILRVL